MDLGYVFLLGIITTAVAWILTAIFHENFVGLLSACGAALFVVPIVFIYISMYFKMEAVSSNVSAMNQISNDAINQIVNYFAGHLPGAVVSDIAGTTVGFVAGLFTTGRNG